MYEMGFTPETLRLLANFKSKVKGLGQAVLRGARQTARELERQTKENLTNDILHVRSGNLRRSVTSGVLPFSGGEVSIFVGSLQGPASPYSRAQEEGRAIIRPTSAEWLAIPVGPALTGAGVPRFASPRDASAELKFIPIDSNTALLVSTGNIAKTVNRLGYFHNPRGTRRTDKRRGEVWYILKKSVQMPASHWLSDSLIGGERLMAYNIQQSVYNHLRS